MAEAIHGSHALRSALACSSNCLASAITHRSTTLRTAARAHSSSVSCRFVMAASSVFFALKGYSTGFKDHVPT